jgi:hypothetical protein
MAALGQVVFYRDSKTAGAQPAIVVKLNGTDEHLIVLPTEPLNTRSVSVNAHFHCNVPNDDAAALDPGLPHWLTTAP